MLRHYDDAHVAVFGMPLYWLYTSNGNNYSMARVFDLACPVNTYGRDPRYQTLRMVALGNSSGTELSVRHDYDRLADRLPILAATLGGTPDEEYADLAHLDPATADAQFESLTRKDRCGLSDLNRIQIVQGARRLQQPLIQRALAEAKGACAALPATEQAVKGCEEIVTPQHLRLTVKATDQNGLSVSENLAVTVKANAPVLAHQTADQAWNDGVAMQFLLPAGTFTDP